jgi:hypothetical protein
MNLRRVQEVLRGAEPRTHVERELVALAGKGGAR